jgi:hypothetical protein
MPKSVSSSQIVQKLISDDPRRARYPALFAPVYSSNGSAGEGVSLRLSWIIFIMAGYFPLLTPACAGKAAEEFGPFLDLIVPGWRRQRDWEGY